MNELGLGVVFSSRDLASQGIRNVAHELLNVVGASSEAGKAIKASFQQFSTGLAVFGAGAGTLAASMKLADIAGEFEASIAAVGAVSGASVADLKRLESAALDAGVATQFDPTQAAVGLGDLAQAGYSASESIALLNPVLDLAAGSLGQLTPSGAAGLASQTLKAFKIPVEEAGATVDKLLQSVNAFALSAGELPLALGVVSRGAGVMNQSLDESLIALGLVKNIIPGVERSGTAVATAMEKMVDPSTQAALAGLGVKVTDAQGRFRPFLDVIQEMVPAMGKMGNESKQSAFLLKTFGTEALGGVQAILSQVTGGLKTNTGEVVKGAAAIDYLRGQFAHSAGTAKQFANALLDTYAGQKKLISGSVETLAIVLGKPLAAAFRPAAEALLKMVNAVLAAVRSIPQPIQDMIAKGVVLAGTVMTVVGGLIAFKATLGIVSAGLSAIGVSTSSFLATLGPVVLLLAAAAAAFYAFKAAYEQNLGGFGDFARQTYEQVSLAFRALGQLFSQGGFSGSVLKELEAGHEGVESFAISVYLTVNRIINFFDGLVTGFRGAMKSLEPTFVAFEAALEELGTTFFGVAEAPNEAGKAFDSFGRAGKKTGDLLATVANVLIGAATAVIKLATAMKPLVDVAGILFDKLGGVEGVAKLLEYALVALAAQRVAMVASTLVDIGAGAVEAALGLGKMLIAAQAAGAFQWANLATTIRGALTSVSAGAAASLAPIAAFAAAVASLYLAYQQWLELKKQLANDDGSAWRKFKRDITGHWSEDGTDDTFNRQLGIHIGGAEDTPGMRSAPGAATYGEMERRRREEIAYQVGASAGSRSDTMSYAPPADYGPTVAASVAAVSSEGASSVDVSALAASVQSLQSSAQSLQSSREAPTNVRANLNVDGRTLAEINMEYSRDISSDNQVPVSVMP